MYDLIIRNGTIVSLEGGIKRGKNIDLNIKKNYDIGIKNKKITKVGKIEQNAKVEIDANGRRVLPAFIDPHTHSLFGGNRVNEFEMRIKGKSYMEIKESGGGIMDTVKKTRSLSETELYNNLQNNLIDMEKWGVCTVECKSGYGLEKNTELKMLKVFKKAISKGFSIVPTFLGAHDIPPEKQKDDYIREILEIIPYISENNLAQFCDVFCEDGFFSKNESKKILIECKKNKLMCKIHADEIKSSGGAELAGEIGCISADHLIHPSKEGIELMAKAGTIAVLLPGTSFYLGSDKPPIKQFRDKGIPIAIGSDFNPGSSPLKYLPIAGSIGAIHYRLTPEEVIAGITINAAYASKLGDKKGSIEEGKDADIVITKYKDFREIPYWIGENPVSTLIKGGEIYG